MRYCTAHRFYHLVWQQWWLSQTPASDFTLPAIGVELYYSYLFIYYHYLLDIIKEVLCVRMSKHFANISKSSIQKCFIVSGQCSSADRPWTESITQYVSICLLFSLREAEKGWAANTFQTLKCSFLHLQSKADLASAALPLILVTAITFAVLFSPPHGSIWPVKAVEIVFSHLLLLEEKDNFLYGMEREGSCDIWQAIASWRMKAECTDLPAI